MSDYLDSLILDYENLSKAMVTATDLAGYGSCLLSSVPARYVTAGGGSRKSLTEQQIAGFCFHDLIQKARSLQAANKREARVALRRFFFRLIEDYSYKYAAALANISRPLSKWKTLTDSYYTAERILLETPGKDSFYENEKKLVNPSTNLFGRPDELLISTDAIRIRDYKLKYRTSSLADPRFYDQLHFYAILASEKYPNRELQLEVHGLLGASLEVPLELDRLDTIYATSARWVSEMQSIGRNKVHPASVCGGCKQCESRFAARAFP